ncbi:MAG: pyridoxamine 5'-phosphate oxidase family protein [Shimia sp.]
MQDPTPQTENTMPADDFWAAFEDVRAGMLKIGDTDFAPMTPFSRPSENALWFVTAKGTDLANAAAHGWSPAQFIVSSNGAGLWATIHGEARIHMDRAKLDEIWNPVTDAWFEEGKSDPDLTMIHFKLSRAEAWTSDGSLKFFYEIAKSQIDDTKPDVGNHGTLTFT